MNSSGHYLPPPPPVDSQACSMLSTTMQYYCPTGQGPYAKPARSAMFSYTTALSEPLEPSPTFLPTPPMQQSPPHPFYSRPLSFFPANSTAQLGSLGDSQHQQPTVSQSSEAAAAVLLSLHDEPIVHSAGSSPTPISPPLKMESCSPVSMTPPPSSSAAAKLEMLADSSTNSCSNTPTEPAYLSQDSIQSEAAATPDYHSASSYTESPTNQVLHYETATPFTVYSAPHQIPSVLRHPYAHASSFPQPPVTAYPSIRYPSSHSVLPGYPFPFQGVQSTEETFPRNNSCHICGKTYARQSTLKTHLRSHSGEKPYQCSICQKSFTQAANLTAHLRTHSGEKPFKCPVCSRGFSQSSSVTTHMRTHSGDRPYKCNVCGKGFADSSTLTKHYRTHTGEKPYQCKICDARFSQSGNLNRHMRTHRNHFQGTQVITRS